MSAQARLVVSAPASGHGKTAVAVGLLAALAARGIPAAGFKVGPDHTDAAYLGLAAGRPGRNLDPRLVGAQRIAPLFLHGSGGAQVSVIEGAMGLFDSLTGQPEIDGTAAVAATLRAPVVLVVDVAAMGHSLAALVHGFRMFDEMVHLGGVVLNRVASSRHEQMLRTALDDIGMPVLGALRRGDLPNVLPARAHGPVPVAHRTVEAGRAVRRLGEAVAGGLDLERLMGLAGSAPALPGPIWTPAEAGSAEGCEQRPVVALAGGPGAPYTYVETAELLTAAGADVAVVDPLRDESLPVGTRALIVGAGLPEGYAEELSANRRLCNEVAQFARDGWPVVAEGVALPWLTHEFDGRPMCGVLDASATTGEQTVAGYREATAPTTSPLAPAGARITGYKQHRALVTPRAGSVPAWTWSGGNPEGFVWRQVHASQLGLHWAAAPEIAHRVVAAAIDGPVPMGTRQPKPPAAMPASAARQPVPPAEPAPMAARSQAAARPAPMSGPVPHAEAARPPVQPAPMSGEVLPPVGGWAPQSGPGAPSEGVWHEVQPAPMSGEVLPPVGGWSPQPGPEGARHAPPPGEAWSSHPGDAARPAPMPGEASRGAWSSHPGEGAQPPSMPGEASGGAWPSHSGEAARPPAMPNDAWASHPAEAARPAPLSGEVLPPAGTWSPQPGPGMPPEGARPPVPPMPMSGEMPPPGAWFPPPPMPSPEDGRPAGPRPGQPGPHAADRPPVRPGRPQDESPNLNDTVDITIP